MVKIRKLWGDAIFSGLPHHSKLLYIYLCSQPTVSTLGVIRIAHSKIQTDLSAYFMPHFDGSLSFLKGSKFLVQVEESDNYYTFIITNHFKSLPKTKTTLRRALDEGKNAEGNLKTELNRVFTKDDFSKKDNFVAPTPQQVSDYAMSKGYIVNGTTFCNYYGDNDWYNKNDKKVRNWKATCDRVWCREENKLTKVEGSPKGFEYFFIETEKGERIFPESWEKGIPSHSNFLYAEMLNDQFNKER